MTWDPLLSTFRRAADPDTVVAAPLSAVALRIRSDELAPACAEIRRLFAVAGGGQAGKDAIREPKKALPGVTCAGTFTRRANAAWQTPSDGVGIDLDDLPPERLEGAWQQLVAAPSVALLYRSPSGTGLKGMVRVPACSGPDHAGYATAWQAVSLWLTSLGLDNDPAVKDVSRLAFLAHDPAAHLNLEAVPLDVAQWTPAPPVDPQPNDPSARLRPGDDYNRRADITPLLLHHGWTLDRIASDGNQHWCRPGKSGGTSATLKNQVFFVFSSSAAPFEPGHGHSPFAVFALLEHGGDFAAAARALRQHGFGDQPLDLQAPPPEPEVPDPGPIPSELLRIPGFVSEVMDHCLATAPYPNQAMAFCGALSLQAFLAGRKVREPGGLRTNLYLLGLAHSASGKDWPRKINAGILHAVGLSDCVGDRFASGEGLQDALFVNPTSLFQTDEIDGLLQSINKAQDARHEGIMGALLTLYTSADSVVPMRRKAGQAAPGVIDQPCLVLFGTAIPNHYYEALSRRMLTNGLFARMIVVEGGKRGVGQDATPADPPTSVLDAARWWANFRPTIGNLGVEHPVPTVVAIDPEAAAVLADCRRQADQEYGLSEDRGDAVGTTVWGRVNEQARKLALIHAVSVNRTQPRIDLPAATWASHFVLHQTRRMLAMAAGHVVENAFHGECQKLIEKLRAEPERMLDHSTALKRMKLRAKEFQEVIDTLVQQGDLEVVTTQRAGTAHRGYRLRAVKAAQTGGETW